MLIVGDYVVLYRLRGGANAEIVRVVHGARRLEDVLGVETDM